MLVSALITRFKPEREREREGEKLNKKINKITSSKWRDGEKRQKRTRSHFFFSVFHHIRHVFKMAYQVKNSALKKMSPSTLFQSLFQLSLVCILDPFSVRKFCNGHF